VKLGLGEVLPEVGHAEPSRLHVGRVRIHVQQAFVLLERLQGRRLVAVGAVSLPVVGLAGLELGVVAARVRRVEGQELPILGDGQDVVGGAPLLEVGFRRAEPSPGEMLALGEAVDDPPVELSSALPLFLLERLFRRLPDDLVGVAGQGGEVPLGRGRAARQGGQ
jgi:hypothetical protein